MTVETKFLTELADTSRRAILNELRSGPRSVMELVTLTKLKQPNVSNHLARLKESGLVISEREGKHIFYRIASPLVITLLTAMRSSLPIETTPEGVRTNLMAWQNKFSDALICGNERDALTVVQECLQSNVSMEDIYVDVMQNSLKLIGDLYFDGKITEADEHLATAITDRLISRVSQFFDTRPSGTKSAILGCVEGNWHSLGLRMIADLLRYAGWDVIYLGPNVPTHSFVSMVLNREPDIVFISCMLETHVEDTKVLISRLRDLQNRDTNVRPLIGVGGVWINHHPDHFDAFQADFTAPDLRSVISTVESLSTKETSDH